MRVVAIVLIQLMGSLVGFAGVADRLLVEINDQSYTQRQLEMYYAVNFVFTSRDQSDLTPLSSVNWPEALRLFRDHMIVAQEAGRLGSFDPSDSQLQRSIEVYRKKEAALSGLAAHSARLDMNERSLRRTIVTAFRIEKYRRGKERQVALKAGSKTIKRLPLQESVWFKDLNSRAVVRFYDRTAAYRSISPQG